MINSLFASTLYSEVGQNKGTYILNSLDNRAGVKYYDFS